MLYLKMVITNPENETEKISIEQESKDSFWLMRENGEGMLLDSSGGMKRFYAALSKFYDENF